MKVILFNPIDLAMFPLAIVLLLMVSKAILRKEDRDTRRFFMQAFWIRVVMLVAFTALMQFYYGGGDSYRYYITLLDIKKALSDGNFSLLDLLLTEKVDSQHILYDYFRFDGMGVNHYYMLSQANFSVPKVGALFSLLFFDSYLAIGLCFSFFALWGSLPVYKIFRQQYPRIQNQIALACFFIPTVCFWSSGILKDSLTFGALGFLFSAAYSLFVRRKKIFSSLLLACLAYYMLYMIKPYIMLAMAPAFLLLVVTQSSSKIKSPSVKKLVYVIMFIAGIGGGFLLYQNLTSDGALERYNTEVILESIDKQRDVYETASMQARSGSNFSLGSDNQILLFPLGIVASYFRPFPWEVNSPIMLLNAAESLGCLLLVLFVFIKVGFLRTFNIIFSNAFPLFCFVFSLLFGGAVGTSTGNFGSLVRYKIPGMPFFVILFFIVLFIAKVKLPARFNRFKLLRTT